MDALDVDMFKVNNNDNIIMVNRCHCGVAIDKFRPTSSPAHLFAIRGKRKRG